MNFDADTLAYYAIHHSSRMSILFAAKEAVSYVTNEHIKSAARDAAERSFYTATQVSTANTAYELVIDLIEGLDDEL